MVPRFSSRLITVLCFTLGLLLGQSAVLMAQGGAVKVKISADNTVCWDQPAATLVEANTMKVRVAYDTATPMDTAFSCVGTASPFTCTLGTKVPLSAQTVGVHRVVIEGANLDQVDSTYTAFAVIEDFFIEFVKPAQPPTKGGGGRIIKVMAAIIKATTALFFGFLG